MRSSLLHPHIIEVYICRLSWIKAALYGIQQHSHDYHKYSSSETCAQTSRILECVLCIQ